MPLMLPLGKPPYTKWEKKLEKKPRMELDIASSSEEEDDDDEGSEYSSTTSEESAKSTQSIDSEEARQRHIRELLPDTPEDGSPPKKKIYFFDDDEPPPPPNLTLFQKLVAIIFQWRERERARRMHYIIKEYEESVLAHDAKLKETIANEIAANERAVKLEAYRSKQRIARSLKKVP